jgi:hypothetical protein
VPEYEELQETCAMLEGDGGDDAGGAEIRDFRNSSKPSLHPFSAALTARGSVQLFSLFNSSSQHRLAHGLQTQLSLPLSLGQRRLRGDGRSSLSPAS